MKYTLFSILILILLAGCNDSTQEYMPIKDFTDSNKPVSYGNHQDVYVFSNQKLSENASDIMKQQFGYPIEGAQKERIFELFWQNFDSFEDLKKAKNIIFICNLEINDNFTAFIKNKIPQAKIDQVMNNLSTMITYQNEWSDDQLVTFVLGKNENEVEDIIITKTANLYLDFEKRFLDRMTRRVYYRGTLKGNSLEEYNYSLQIPSSFQLYKEVKSENMISFIYRYKKKETILPDKFITVYQEKMDVDNFTELWVKKSRKNMGQVILDEDKIDWNRAKVMPKTFNTWNGKDYFGYIFEGAWENKQNNMGGSFKSYAFYDDKVKTAFFIDTAVYYPAGTKIPYLYELEGIAKSFNIKE